MGCFGTEEEYGTFLLARLRPGSCLVDVVTGRTGTFIKAVDSDSKPCKMRMSDDDRRVDWRDVELEACFTPALHLLCNCVAPLLRLLRTCFTPAHTCLALLRFC